ncbi:MAG: hypothetical protein ACR2NZ_20975 [Rubripirellula sp.]
MNGQQIKRRRLMAAGLLAVLAVYAVFGVLDARSARKRLTETRRDASEIEGMLADITRLRTAPKVAALQLQSPAEITNRIAAARQIAGLPESSLLKEEPLSPQRIQRSDFELRSTTIDLAPATLPQILQFCEALRDEETGTLVRDISLSEPTGEANGRGQEKWEATLVLTQMIFSPKSR